MLQVSIVRMSMDVNTCGGCGVLATNCQRCDSLLVDFAFGSSHGAGFGADTVLAAIRPPGELKFPPASVFGLCGLHGVMQALAAAARLGRHGGACPSFCRKAFDVDAAAAIAATQASYELVTLLSRSARKHCHDSCT